MPSTQPPPPPREGLPAAFYILAAALCVLGFILFLLFLYYTRRFAQHAPQQQPPIPMQQLGRSASALDRRVLDTIPTLSWSAEAATATVCAICLSDYEEADEVRALPCQHVYHVTCVDTWFDSHSSCPTCRRDLRAEEDVDG